MKNVQHRIVWTAAATAMLVSGTSALAQGAAYATASPIEYTLLDLDPNDGIAPELTWGQGTSSAGLKIRTQTGKSDATWTMPLVTPYFTTVYSHTSSNAGPQGTVVAEVFEQHQASTGPQGVSVSAAYPLGADWDNRASFASVFTLTPNTAVTFSSKVSGGLSVNVPNESAGYPNGYMDWAYIQASSFGTISIEGVPITYGDGHAASMFLRSYDTDSKTIDQPLSATLRNTTSDSISSEVSLIAGVSGYTVAPIPEASTAAQMALGLMGLLALTKRTRQKRGV
jgi:hypothetical protein